MAKNYPTDVSDEEWALIKLEICALDKPRGKGRIASEASSRACFNALRYLLKTGCQWRMLPKEYPPRSTVHDALSRWTRNGVLERINGEQTRQRRELVKKTPSPARRSSTAKA
ncbi:MAG TPA: transposase [Prosthecobacter sp.]|nr:transposase [Prosthecobacter sp.]HRK12744.1 transposase [Prosthecobacter sp.]